MNFLLQEQNDSHGLIPAIRDNCDLSPDVSKRFEADSNCEGLRNADSDFRQGSSGFANALADVIQNPFTESFQGKCLNAISDLDRLVCREIQSANTSQLLDRLNFTANELEQLSEKVLAKTKLHMVSDQSISADTDMEPAHIDLVHDGEFLDPFAIRDAQLLLALLRKKLPKIDEPTIELDERGRVTFDWIFGETHVQWTISDSGSSWPLVKVYEYRSTRFRRGGRVVIFYNPISLLESLGESISG